MDLAWRLGVSMNLGRLARSLSVLLALLWAACANAAEQVRIVVGFPSGSGLDVLTRIVAERMRADGVTVIVDNRPGGGGRVAAEVVAKADPDGTVILSAPIVTTAFTPFVFKQLSFDPMRDLAPITRLGNFQFALAVNNDVPADSVRSFIDWVKANPGKVSYGSLSAGTPSHFLGVMFNRAVGADMTHVPYRGSGPVNIDLQSGQIQAVFNTTVATMELYKAKKIKLLAVTGGQRSQSLPEVPTFKELKMNLGEMEDAELWYGFLAPGRTPPAIVQKLNERLTTALKDPDVRKLMTSLDIQVAIDTPEEFAKIIASDYRRWGEIIKSTGFTLNE